MKYLTYIFALLMLCSACSKLELAEGKSDKENATDSTSNATQEMDSTSLAYILEQEETGSAVALKGYIVGYVASNSIKKAVFGTENAVASNVLIASSPDENNYLNCVPCQLSANTYMRETFNLKDNPTMLYAYVQAEGTKATYFNTNGLKPLSDMFLADDSTDDNNDKEEDDDSKQEDTETDTNHPDFPTLGQDTEVFEGA